MIDFILVKYVHFIGIFAVVGSLVGEALLLKPELKRSEIARLSRVDMVYGLGHYGCFRSRIYSLVCYW